MRLFVIALLVGAVGCEATETEAGQAAATPTTWYTVAEWSGSGAKNTETFTIPSKEWRISWSTSNEAFPGAGIFQIYVHDSGGDLLGVGANQQGVGSDVSYMRGSGPRYLAINAGNLDWTVKVEAQR